MHACSNVLRVQAKCQCFALPRQATMGKDRLSYLTLLHVHYDTDIDIDNAINQFARLHPRRLELESVLFA